MEGRFRLRDPQAIGVAVLGAGRMGQTHLRTLAGIGHVQVVAVADPDHAAAERGRALAGAPRALSEPLEAIADPAVDAVVVVTPTSTHAALIEAALDAGKAVWSEKPIALDLAQTERVVARWRASAGRASWWWPTPIPRRPSAAARSRAPLEPSASRSRRSGCSWRFWRRA